MCNEREAHGHYQLVWWERLSCCACCRHSCSRAVLAVFGAVLLCALFYIVLLYILLFGGWSNPWCDGFIFNKVGPDRPFPLSPVSCSY